MYLDEGFFFFSFNFIDCLYIKNGNMKSTMVQCKKTKRNKNKNLEIFPLNWGELRRNIGVSLAIFEFEIQMLPFVRCRRWIHHN